MLYDFGLAKLLQVGPSEPPSAPRKLTGETGSARYMAPEVARSRPCAPHAILYSPASPKHPMPHTPSPDARAMHRCGHGAYIYTVCPRVMGRRHECGGLSPDLN